MKLSVTYPVYQNSTNIPFKKLFSNFCTDGIIRNKVKSGQLIEKLCDEDFKWKKLIIK